MIYINVLKNKNDLYKYQIDLYLCALNKKINYIMTETIQDYTSTINKDQEQIVIHTGPAKLSNEEIKEIAQNHEVQNYQVRILEQWSASRDPELEGLKYILAYGPKSRYWNTEKASVLKPENIEKIHDQFKSEGDYRRVLQALRQTRTGLMHIHGQSPNYKDEIFKQMEAVNNLIGALIVDDLPHPWLEEPTEPVNDLLALQ